ncbi:MAG TPA: MerR family transcriptional regulator [Nitrospiria bacterium]|nr:MerR family transcriptional regulator [Nitrospiria bacterium]
MRNEHEKKSRISTQSSHPYGAKEICQAVGISHRQLDYWVLIGVVTPHLERHGAKLFRRFSRHDVTVLQRIKHLIDEGVVVSRAAERVHREMGQGTALDSAPSNDGRATSTVPRLEGQEPETDAA